MNGPIFTYFGSMTRFYDKNCDLDCSLAMVPLLWGTNISAAAGYTVEHYYLNWSLDQPNFSKIKFALELAIKFLIPTLSAGKLAWLFLFKR